MAYADKQEMSGNRIAVIVVVAVLHGLLGFALVTGLAFEAITKVKEKLTVVAVDPEKPPEEEPPPPPPDKPLVPPPPYVPPSPFERPAPNPDRQADKPPPKPVFDPNAGKDNGPPPGPKTKTCPGGAIVLESQDCPAQTKTCPKGEVVPINASCPEPEKPKVSSRPKPVPKGNPGNWANTNDYPSRALQQEREGVTRFTVSVGPDGRVASCSVTGSSGHSDLDDTTCKKITQRGRFEPALDGNGTPISGSYTNSIRWSIPKDR
jgi:periplasmic protein TonB